MSNKIDSTNDPFDEFEFKPLTSGLGFHKKATDTTTAKSSSAPSITSKIDFKGSHLSFDHTETSSVNSKESPSSSGFNLKSPLPRTSDVAVTSQPNLKTKTTINIPTIEDDSITKAQTAVNEILKNLNQKKQQEEFLSKSTQRKVWDAATPSLTAGFLDTLLITAFFLLSLVIMLAITKIDLVANLTQPDPQYLIYWATLSLLAGIQIIYFVSCRAYLGCTPGEWAFDQRCGNEVQLASSTYTLRVMARSILNIVTGFVTFSIISAIVKFDVLSALTGLQVQKQKLAKPQ